jgi:hypothetical protein
MTRRQPIYSTRGGAISSRSLAVFWRMWPRNGVTFSNISDSRRVHRCLPPVKQGAATGGD